MTAHEVLLRELNSIIGLLPNYRRTAANQEANFKRFQSDETFKAFVEAEFDLRMVEERMNFILLVLDEVDE